MVVVIQLKVSIIIRMICTWYVTMYVCMYNDSSMKEWNQTLSFYHIPVPRAPESVLSYMHVCVYVPIPQPVSQ